jgi:hypothetical protein
MKSFVELMKNKVFLISLLIINTIIFIFGFIISEFELMIMALLSYAAVLVGIETNKESENNKDE